MSGPSIEFGAVDLTNCDREPIHIPGSIQPHGALIALDPAGLRIVIAGGDTEKLLGLSTMALLGASARNIMSNKQQQRLRDLLTSDHPLVRPMYVFTLPVGQQEPTDVIAHVSGGLLVLEYEPRREPHPDYSLALVQAMSRKVQQADSLQALYDAMATEVRNVIGFDRSMVYRFAADGSGAVVAESRDPGVDSFLGLNFPATDIPRQARALYRANWIRHIPDARYEPVLLTPPLNPLTNSPLDLSQSVLRSVSPVHRQYLANMGVVASMSLSLIPRGQLWGLIACHHHAPRYVPQRLRDVCEIFAEMASSHLEMKLIGIDLKAQLHATRIHEELVTRMSQEADLADGLMRCRPNLLDLIPAEGVGLWVEGRFIAIGTTPAPEQIAALVDWLNTTAKDGIFQTDYLPAVYPPAESFAAIASGLLALSVSRSPRDYVLWFRPEMSSTVTWAGNPAKPVEIRPDGAHLTPRNSFAAWQESVGMHASPWLAVELETAHRLRVSLLEVVLRRIDQMAREREAARLQQEKLSKELDRRLEEWRRVAEALNKETERRALVEADLSMVLRRTVADQEAERERLARELHDTLGQSLTLLQLGLEGLGRMLPESTEFEDRLAALKLLISEFGSDLNRLAWDIRPTALDDLGIQTAIRNLVEIWSERSNMQFDLHLTLGDKRLPPDVETTLYRVLQEALTNVVRHAGATRVGIVLGRSEQVVTIIVEDNGRGFVNGATGLDHLPAKRLGLIGIRERLALVEGSLEIESAPGKGTTLFIRIPL